MKKLFLLLALVTSISFSAFAAENKNGGNSSSISYYNVPILKIYDGKDGYVVIYQKNKTGVGTTVIPKKWLEGNPDNPRKLKLRKLEKGLLEPFMTVVKKDGQFLRVILTLPMSKQNSIWGVLDQNQRLEGTDKDTLEELEL